MSTGSRSRTGCYTCRIRKKKCDERQPSCQNCQTRNLPCYGYHLPPPDWMQGKRDWREITACLEAQELRKSADVQYKARRRNVATSASNPTDGDMIQPPAAENLWWDGTLRAALPVDKPPHEDTRLIMLFLEFIFPIQFGFYPMFTAMDRTWLISGLCSNKARYDAALSVSACFDASLREPQKTDGIGLSLEVTERQAEASSGLQKIIAEFRENEFGEREVVKMGVKILEVMHQLLSLEIFSMLEGRWELHHQATRTLLNTLHTYRNPEPSREKGVALQVSPLEMALKDSSCSDTQRTLEFHVTCVVWVDIISNATFGFPSGVLRHFDYTPHLHADSLKTQHVMGCHSSVMANIVEITCLEDWKTCQLETTSLLTEELTERAMSIATRLLDQVKDLEQRFETHMTQLEAESHLVTLQFACAAQIYLHVILFGFDTADPRLSQLVRRNLESLEALPNGLLIRVNWAFTISGCMAGKQLHDRFRGLIARLSAQRLPLGMAWKGLIVMEECWRLRECHSHLESTCDWKMAMKNLGARILLV